MCRKLFLLISLVVVLGLVSNASAQNLLHNPGFESNDGSPGSPADFWANSEEAGVENWPGAPYSGNWLMAIVTWRGDGTGEVYQDVSDVVEDMPYTYTLWTRRDTGTLSGHFYMKIEWYNNDTFLGENELTLDIPSGYWEQKTLEAIAPVGSSRARIVFGSVDINLVGKFDDAGFEMIHQCAYNPSPVDDVNCAGPEVDLDWSPGCDAISHDVYFGTNPTPAAGEFQGNQTAMTFDPGTLELNTTYYWRIDEVNGPDTWEGDVWNFTTRDTVNPSYGINVHAPISSEVDYLFDEVAACKLGWIRMDFNWEAIETSQDNFDWSIHDAVVEAANVRGLNIFATLAYTPAWAVKSGYSGPHAIPNSSADWYDFCYRAAERYKDSIEYWGMWNEPDLICSEDNGWGSTMDARISKYINDILINGSNAVKAADATAKVCGPELAHTGSHWIKWYLWLKRCIEEAGNKMDVITHHIHVEDTRRYPEVTEKLEATTQYGDNPDMWDTVEPSVKEVLEYTNWSGQFWLTETGLQSDNISESDQARFYTGLLTDWFSGIEGRNWMDKIFFYELRDSTDWREYWGILGTAEEDFYRKEAFYTCQTPVVKPFYMDANRPMDERIENLLSRMTPEEKFKQISVPSPAIERLGVPEHFWVNECLHGVLTNGVTVFPQAIGMASTWNPELIGEISTAISDEARALYNEELRPYLGLSYFSPTINMGRDPRWGRTQEGYGEDPYLVSQMATNFVRGIQGDDPDYLKLIATPKHLTANNEEWRRYSGSSEIDERMLHEYYLPQFKACVVESDAQSVMGAYNALNGIPCCCHKELLTDILRDDWGFDGYVVSDCGGIWHIHGDPGHHYTSTPQEAVTLAIKAGLDLNCGDQYSKYLGNAIELSLITEEEVDIAVYRVLTAMFRLGMFDPAELNPYNDISSDVIDCSAHRQLALKTSRESIVLLKNENNFLPLDPAGITSIAVIGPLGDEDSFGTYCGWPNIVVSPLEGITNKASEHGISVSFEKGCEEGCDMSPPPVPAECLLDLIGEYFNNPELSGDPVLVRNDDQIKFDWGEGSPHVVVNSDNFSVRWTGKLVPPISGICELVITGDDGMRLYIDDELVIDCWNTSDDEKNREYLNLNAGQEYNIKVEYYEGTVKARAYLGWDLTDLVLEGKTQDAVNLAAQKDIAIVCVGTNSQVEAETRDRFKISLPGTQEDLIKEIYNVNPNTVVVLIHGSPLEIGWLKDNIPAIVEAWYCGQEGGVAIADVLFGDYNPAGRLPMTFYSSLEQLSNFSDYDITKGMTYMYLDEQPLFAFGHGLSYTTFAYSNLQISPSTIWSGDEISVSVDVQNTGSRTGDEVVQLYVHDPDASVTTPIKALKGFERINLMPAQQKTVTLTIPIRDLSYKDLSFYDISQKGFVVDGGLFEVMAGSSSDNIKLSGSFEVISLAWQQTPSPATTSSITMTAVLSDPASQDTAEYYFECVSGGGHDSGWQDSPIYVDNGLLTETMYTYHVKARDKNTPQNEAAWTPKASSTVVEKVPPTPNPATWFVVPYRTGSTSILMTATTASDVSGVQYYFECTAGSGHNSSWQDSPTYEDIGLSANTQYTYRVKARDKSPDHNETGWSFQQSATTKVAPSVYLRGYWKLDESSGTTAADSSGYWHNGSLVGNPEWVTGQVDGAILLNGSGDYITIPSESFFDITSEITISCWIKVNNFDADWKPIVTKGDTAWRISRYMNTSRIHFACNDVVTLSDNNHINGNVNVDDDEWHHIAAVYDGSKMYLYIDGVLDVSVSASGSIATNNYSVAIGKNLEVDWVGEFNGLIDDVRIYSHGLSEHEIRDSIIGSVIHMDVPYSQRCQDNYSGAACLKICLDYEADNSYTQADLHDYGVANNTADNQGSDYIDPSGMYLAMNHYELNWNYNYDALSNTTLNDAYHSLCHWIAYCAPNTDPENMPSMIPLYGSYENWTVVNGFSTSDDPWTASNYIVYGFWITDPAAGGIGQSVYKTATALGDSFTALNTSDLWNGKYVTVCEPPEHDAEVTIAEPVKFKDKLSSKQDIIDAAIKGLKSNVLKFDVEFDDAYIGSRPGKPILVRSDNGNYFIVPFVKDNGCSVAVIIDAQNGTFKEASYSDMPDVKYLKHFERPKEKKMARKLGTKGGVDELPKARNSFLPSVDCIEIID